MAADYLPRNARSRPGRGSATWPDRWRGHRGQARSRRRSWGSLLPPVHGKRRSTGDSSAFRASPTLGWFTECVEEILTRLRSQTSARIAVIDIPMIGEDLSSDLNRRMASYNRALRRVAAAHAAECLPLHDRLASLLPSPHNPPPYRGRFGPMITASLRHHILRRSWDQISAANGLIVLIDQVHLNDRAAGLTADLVADFITGS